MAKFWEKATLSDVYDNGPGYMYSLLCDYEKYVRDFGYIPINNFIPKWTCISYILFSNLIPGDIVFSPQGTKFIIIDYPFESDDEALLCVEVAILKDDGTYDDTGQYTEILQSGDLYSTDIVHLDYRWKKIKRKESEEPLCPILITKTNQLQS